MRDHKASRGERGGGDLGLNTTFLSIWQLSFSTLFLHEERAPFLGKWQVFWFRCCSKPSEWLTGKLSKLQSPAEKE
jgi:hypothetical protein